MARRKRSGKGNKAKKQAPQRARAAPSKNDAVKIAKMVAKEVLVHGAGTLGGAIGGPPGALMGKKAGAYISRIFGMGDYTINRNSILMGDTPPVFGKSGHQARIRHREFLADIVGSTSFSNREYPINIGMRQSFPWLSSVAQNYQQFRIHGLVFEFKSTSASALNSTNTALGTVIMATQYNYYAPQFLNKVEMESSEFCVSSKPSENCIHPIECAPPETSLEVLYVRSGGVPSGADIRFFDLGTFSIATVGMQAAATIGELWVSYDVELIKPALDNGSYSSAISSSYAAGPYSATNYLGLTPVTVYGGLSYAIEASGGTNYDRIRFPYWLQSGYYIMTITWTGASTAALAIPAIAYSGCIAGPKIWTSGTAASISNTVTTSGNLFYLLNLEIFAPNATMTFSGGNLPATPANVTITIAQVSNSYFPSLALSYHKLDVEQEIVKQKSSEYTLVDEEDEKGYPPFSRRNTDPLRGCHSCSYDV